MARFEDITDDELSSINIPNIKGAKIPKLDFNPIFNNCNNITINFTNI